MIPAPVGAVLVSLALAVSAPAVRVDTVTVGPATGPTVDGRCAQWADLAFSIGWPRDEWPTLDRVMWCESRCDPVAHNRSGATGLLQIMPMHWHGRDPFDPATNLTIGLEVRQSQGWRAWSCY